MTALVLGHKNPDTDSIVSALAAANLYKGRGLDVTPVAQGEPAPETAFVLKTFGLKAPEVVTSVAGKEVYLVDYSDLAQAPADFKDAKLLGIIDHHKLGDVTSDTPVECWIQPVGCSNTVIKKLHDYGPAWRILRPVSVTDQLFIKANRIRSIETKGVALVNEGVRSEFMAIVNYGIIGLIQLELGYAEKADISNDEALALYDKYAKASLELMLAKNHDYDEAWRSMRISSYTDLILMKIYRTKQIESLAGETLVSEGVDANYMDMINYSVFALIKIEFGD